MFHFQMLVYLVFCLPVNKTMQKRRKILRSEGQRDVLRKMKSFPETFDIDFIVEGEKFPAHRAWIAATSPVFHALLTNNMKESSQRQVKVEDVRARIWKSVLDYIYYEKSISRTLKKGYC